MDNSQAFDESEDPSVVPIDETMTTTGQLNTETEPTMEHQNMDTTEAHLVQEVDENHVMEGSETKQTLETNEQNKISRDKNNQTNANKAAKSNRKLPSKAGKAEPLFSCPDCPKTYARKDSLIRHAKSHKGRVVCFICYTEVGDDGDIDTHIKKKHQDKSSICKCICDKVFDSLESLQEHQEYCLSHLRAMINHKSYTCPECNGKFTRKDSLTKHLLNHHPERKKEPREKNKSNTCPDCKKTFKRKDYLKKHRLSQHPNRNDETLEDPEGESEIETADLETMVTEDAYPTTTVPEIVPPSRRYGLRTKTTSSRIANDSASKSITRSRHSGRTETKAKHMDRNLTNKNVLKGKSNKSKHFDKKALIKKKLKSKTGKNTAILSQITTKQADSVGQKEDKWKVDTSAPTEEVVKFHKSMKTMTELLLETTDSEEARVMEDLQTMVCRLEGLGREVLVMTTDRDNCVWHGSSMATQFVNNKSELLLQFFLYCQEKMQHKKMVLPEELEMVQGHSQTEHTKIKVKKQAWKDNSPDIEMDYDLIDTTPDIAAPIEDVNDMYNEFNGDYGEDMDEPNHEQNFVNNTNSEFDDGSEDNVDKVNTDENTPDKLLKLNVKLEDDDSETKFTSSDSELALFDGKTMEDTTIGKFECGKCQCKFIHPQHLKTHLIRRPNCDTENLVYSGRQVNVLDEKVSYVDGNSGETVVKSLREMVVSQNPPYKCFVCSTGQRSKRSLMRHVAIHATDTAFGCYICGCRFRIAEAIRPHLKKYHFQRPYSCDSCHKSFESKSLLNEHNEIKCAGGIEEYNTGSEKDPTCKQCGLKLKNMRLLEAHLATHGDVNPFKCSVPSCGKQFKDMYAYRRHLNLHDNENFSSEKNQSFPCNVCGKVFYGEISYLKQHMRSHSTELPFVCDFCGEKFKRKIVFDNHRRLHTGERPYKCDNEDCGKGFRSAASLLQHQRTHNATGEYICDVCGRRFKQPSALRHHHKNHTIEWRWPCLYCEEKYKSLWKYKNHLANTHPEKKDEIKDKLMICLHQCPQCPKVYHDTEDLRRHINNHFGIKPFACEHCSKAFSDKSNLRNHMHIHTGVKKSKCSVCYKTFLHQKNLDLHMDKVHQKVLTDAPVIIQTDAEVIVQQDAAVIVETNIEEKEATEFIIDWTVDV